MNAAITRFFGRTVSSAAFDTKLGQGVCYVGSVVVGAVTWWKLTQLELTEAQFFFGMLLSLCVPLLLLIVGMVLPGAIASSGQHS